MSNFVPLTPYLSIIMPVYNAKNFINNALSKLSEWCSLHSNIEVIIIDDGSKDGTPYIINKNFSNFKLISLHKNYGKGYAVREGMLESKGKYRIFTDADLPYGVEIFEKIIYYLEHKGFDLCIGSRNLPDSDFKIPKKLTRRLASIIFTFLISKYIVTGVHDTQCGIKGIRGEIADILFPILSISGFAFDVELLYLSYKLNLDVKRIPVKFVGNDISSVRVFSDSITMLYDVLSIPFKYYFKHNYDTITVQNLKFAHKLKSLELKRIEMVKF